MSESDKAKKKGSEEEKPRRSSRLAALSSKGSREVQSDPVSQSRKNNPRPATPGAPATNPKSRVQPTAATGQGNPSPVSHSSPKQPKTPAVPQKEQPGPSSMPARKYNKVPTQGPASAPPKQRYSEKSTLIALIPEDEAITDQTGPNITTAESQDPVASKLPASDPPQGNEQALDTNPNSPVDRAETPLRNNISYRMDSINVSTVRTGDEDDGIEEEEEEDFQEAIGWIDEDTRSNQVHRYDTPGHDPPQRGTGHISPVVLAPDPQTEGYGNESLQPDGYGLPLPHTEVYQVTNTLTTELIEFLELFHVDIRKATILLRHAQVYSVQHFLDFANQSLPEIIRGVTLRLASVYFKEVTKFMLIPTFMKSMLNMGQAFRVPEGFSNLTAETMPDKVVDFTWYEVSFFEDTQKHVLTVIEKLHAQRQRRMQEQIDERDLHVQELADQYQDAWQEPEETIDLTQSSIPAGSINSKRSAFSPAKGTPDKATTSPNKKKSRQTTFDEYWPKRSELNANIAIADHTQAPSQLSNGKEIPQSVVVNTHVDGRQYYEDPVTGDLMWLQQHMDVNPDQHMSTNVRKNQAAAMDMARHERVAKNVIRGGFGRGDPRSTAGRSGRGGRGKFNNMQPRTTNGNNQGYISPHNDGSPVDPPQVQRYSDNPEVYRPPHLRNGPPKYPDWLHNPRAPAPANTSAPPFKKNLYSNPAGYNDSRYDGNPRFQLPAGHVSIPPTRFRRGASPSNPGRTAKHKIRRPGSPPSQSDPSKKYTPSIYLPPDDDGDDPGHDTPSQVTYAHPWSNMSTTPPRKRSAIDFKAVWDDKDKTIPEIVDIVHSWMLNNMMSYIMTADFKAAYLTGGIQTSLPYTYGITEAQLMVDKQQAFAAIQSVLRRSKRAIHLVSKHKADQDGFLLWYDFLGEFNNEQDVERRMNELRNLAQQNWKENYPGGITQYLNDYLHYNNQMDYLDPWYQQHEYIPDEERITRMKEMFIEHPMYAHIAALCDNAPLHGDSLDDFIQKLKKTLAPTVNRRTAYQTATHDIADDLPPSRSALRAIRERDQDAYRASIEAPLPSYDNDEEGTGDPFMAMQTMLEAMMAYRDQLRNQQPYHPDYRLSTPAYRLMQDINEKWTKEYDRRRRLQGAPSGGGLIIIDKRSILMIVAIFVQQEIKISARMNKHLQLVHLLRQQQRKLRLVHTLRDKIQD